MSTSQDYTFGTPRIEDAYEAMPGTTKSIASDLGVSKSRARDLISSLRYTAGVPISQDENGIYYDRSYSIEANQTAPAEAPQPEEERSSLAQHTISKKEVLLEMERSLAATLKDNEPVVADGGVVSQPGNEDVVIHRSDDHLGAEYEDEFDNVVFDPDIGEARVNAVTDEVMQQVNRQKRAGLEFDTAHLLLGGDTVHGEGIHKKQPWESAITLVNQIELGHDLYVEQIERLRDEFDHVQVVGTNGNHGELRGDGMSDDANADDIVYMMIEKTADNREWDDVTIVRSSGSFFTNFRMRVDEEEDRKKADALDLDSVRQLPPNQQSGHRGHLRHGQNSLFHIGTSSGENRWRGWADMHSFEIAYRGHFHEFRIENIDGKPVIMSGSICPPEDYEEGMATWSEPAATVHGVSDDEPMTWFYPIQFDDGRDEAEPNSVMAA
jgi:hypothetical protein